MVDNQVRIGPSKMTSQRIAHIDTDPGVRDVIIECLQPYGFVVNGYENAPAFLSDFKIGLFDLRIFESYRTGGGKMFRQIKAIDPKQKFLFVTSLDIDDGLFKEIFPDADFPYIRKPVLIENLVSEINKALGIDSQKLK